MANAIIIKINVQRQANIPLKQQQIIPVSSFDASLTIIFFGKVYLIGLHVPCEARTKS
jgi:hypothetical protein